MKKPSSSNDDGDAANRRRIRRRSCGKNPLWKRCSILIGSIISFAAGNTKELGDELGFFKSVGASTKEVVPDLLGILLAAVML
ncbi:hypothetical protein ACS0TY_026324 [Phlomoides rotata]